MNNSESNSNGVTNGINSEVLGSVSTPTPAPTLNPEIPTTNQSVSTTETIDTTLTQAAANTPVANVNPEPVVTTGINPTVNLNESTAPQQSEPVSTNTEIPSISNNTMTTDTATPVAQPAPVETVSTPSSPVAAPIPGTEGLTGNTISSGVTPVGNVVLNQGGVDNIGIVPPMQQPKKDKPKMNNKVIFIVLIVVLLVGIAFGVYFLLNKSKQVKLTPKTVEIGIGDVLSERISDLATVTKGDTSNCYIDKNDKNKINTQEVGEYTFKIVCGKQVFTGGKVIVKDTTKPKLYLNTLFITEDDSVSLDDFVSSCTDNTECTTSFVSESEITANAKTAGGPYKVSIKATDNSGNETVGDTNLYVTKETIRAYFKCNSSELSVDNSNAKKVIQDLLPLGTITEGLDYLGVSVRNYHYTFASEEEYLTAIGEKNSVISFDNNEGVATYDDDNWAFTITTDLSANTLNSEAGENLQTTFNDISNYYREKGYTCAASKYTSIISYN